MFIHPPVTIRPAEAADCDALCELFLDFHDFHTRGVPDRLTTMRDPAGRHREELAARLASLAAGHGSNLIVAELDGELAGVVEVYLRQSDPSAPVVPRKYAYLQSLMVAEHARGEGLGALLLAAAEAWARDRGASEIQLDVWEFPDGPLSFYERHGYHTMRRSLVRRLS
ncbi:MAG: GNAT family N-acetyltransferase [Chloroflexales bacterium]|nr:GNAT family N-acetyltransferase [Chloroflexales bacterium]